MPNKTTTIEIFHYLAPTWNRWKKIKHCSSAELHKQILEAAQDKIRFDTYVKSLSLIDNYKRPLSYCKIDKSKLSIGN